MVNGFSNTIFNGRRIYHADCVVNDQIVTRTYTKGLARILIGLVETEVFGYYNVTNDKGC